jgi:membrane-associated phospholipid phosphatase
VNGVAGYAGALPNPTLQFGLQASRQHLVDSDVLAKLPDTAFGPKHSSRTFEDSTDAPANLARWQPDVRLAVLAWEAGEGMRFAAEGGTATLFLRDQPLVGLSRPGRAALSLHAGIVADFGASRLNDKVYVTRHNEILTQVTAPFAYWSAILPMHPDRMPRTFELMQLALCLASGIALRFKHALACPRPHELDSRVHPMVLTPGHSSLPSGHAAESSAVSMVLSHLVAEDSTTESPTHAGALRELAHRIAENRVYAGLHYPIDSVAGHLLGETVGEYFVALCRGGMDVQARVFDGKDATGDVDAETAGIGVPASALPLCRPQGDALSVTARPQLQWLWTLARAEWGHEVV